MAIYRGIRNIMSGYDSISDYAFENFNIDNYENYLEWLQDVEEDFLSNGRSPLQNIFDSSDYTRLRNEWKKRKEEEEEEDDIDPPLPPEEEEENIIEKVIKPVTEFIGKTVDKIKGFFGL